MYVFTFFKLQTDKSVNLRFVCPQAWSKELLSEEINKNILFPISARNCILNVIKSSYPGLTDVCIYFYFQLETQSKKKKFI